MLKPKFKNMASMLSEFNSALAYLDEHYPKDPSQLPKPKIAPKSLSESKQEVKEKPAVLAEAAPLSRYSTSGKALDSFRVLAGLEVREISPWNAGIAGETRSVRQLQEDFGMAEGFTSGIVSFSNNMAPTQNEYDMGMTGGGEAFAGEDTDTGGDAAPEKYQYKKNLGGFTPKAAHKALSHSHRVLSMQHAHHAYMHELDPQSAAHVKEKLGKAAGHAAYLLRGAADGAPPDMHDKLHGLADRHERHAHIYAKGGRPKLEATEEMMDLIDSIDPVEFFQ